MAKQAVWGTFTVELYCTHDIPYFFELRHSFELKPTSTGLPVKGGWGHISNFTLTMIHQFNYKRQVYLTFDI